MHTKQSTILLNKNNGFSTAAAENAKNTHTQTHIHSKRNKSHLKHTVRQ